MKYSWMIVCCLLLCGCDEIKQRRIAREKATISVSFYLTTVVHDEHLFVLSTDGNFIHHPSCPCLKNKPAEKSETTNYLPPIIIDTTKSILINP
jgi:hypothetical protein